MSMMLCHAVIGVALSVACDLCIELQRMEHACMAMRACKRRTLGAALGASAAWLPGMSLPLCSHSHDACLVVLVIVTRAREERMNGVTCMRAVLRLL